jgi:hypothetical protein
MTLNKTADIGGQGGDADFESSFSGLAHAFLREKAPVLEPYELGFQLLERSDEGDRAVGITGFQVGKQLLYAPVFWLNGQIKGSELMFVHSTSMFVPCKENWINYILGRKTQQIGDAVNRNPRELGIRQPDLKRMTRSPYKFASERVRWQNWALWGDESLCKVASEKLAPSVSLPEFIEACGPKGVKAFHKMAEVSPSTVVAAYEFHGERLMEALRKAAASTDAATPQADGNADNSTPMKSGGPDIVDLDAQTGMKLHVYTLDVAEVPADMSDEDREQLMRDGFVIHDLREDDATSRAYAEEGPAHVVNPVETGLYDVITKFDGVAKCLVLANPWGPEGREGYSLVVKLEGGERSYTAEKRNNIWTTKQYDQTEFQKFLDDLKSADDLNSDGDEQVMLVRADGHGSLPLQLQGGTWDADGVVAYRVSAAKDYVPGIVRDTKKGPGPNNYGTKQVVIDNSSRTKFRAYEGKLFVPNDAKVIKTGSRYGDGIILGRAGDLKNALYRSLSKMAVFRSGNEVVLSDDSGQSKPMSPQRAIIQLVTKTGLREKTARALLKTAETQRVARCMVKIAEPYLTGQPPFALPSELDFQHQGSMQLMDGDSVPTNEYSAQNISVGMPKEYIRQPIRPVHYVDDGAFDIARQASQSGQKEVFDASAMTSMLRNMRDDQLIDRFIPSLTTALDSTGRLLFQFYWHQEDFAERYGDRDMPELEDGLRNQFEGLGDIVLKLKQKTVDPYPEDTAGGVDLTDIAGAS